MEIGSRRRGGGEQSLLLQQASQGERAEAAAGSPQEIAAREGERMRGCEQVRDVHDCLDSNNPPSAASFLVGRLKIHGDEAVAGQPQRHDRQRIANRAGAVHISISARSSR